MIIFTTNGRIRTLLAILFSWLIFSMPLAHAVNKSKSPAKAGRTLPAVINTILNGVGVPNSALGRDGDFYIDVRGAQMFGPKVKGRWPLPFSLVGPVGALGPLGLAGKQGTKGDDGPAGSSTAGLTGAPGPQGPIGVQGPSGPPGLLGSQGPVGAAGSAGPTGVAGSQGATGLQGLTGSSGTGSAGPQGATGSQGIQGVQGAIGGTGPSTVTKSQVLQFNLTSPAGIHTSTSSAFGTLSAGKFYQYSIVLHGVFASTSRFFGAVMLGTSTVTTIYDWVLLDGSAVRSGSLPQNEMSFLIFGTAAGGASGGALRVSITDFDGSTNVSTMSVSGQCLLQEVGAIS